jgi:hypothetical protein
MKRADREARLGCIADALCEGMTQHDATRMFAVSLTVIKHAASLHRTRIAEAREQRRIAGKPPPTPPPPPSRPTIGPGLRHQIELAKAEAATAPLYRPKERS